MEKKKKNDYWDNEKTKCDQKTRKTTIKFKSLRFEKCIFMTDEQLNKTQIHKPKNTLFIEKKIYANSTDDVDNTINNIINDIHKKLIEIYNPNIKIPYPIFVLLGRELELDSNLFDVEIFEHEPKITPPQKTIKYGNTEIPINNNKLVILDYLKGFFKSGLSNEIDEYKYKSSIINSYKFKGNIRIYLYVPFLTNTYKFIANLYDLTNSFYFFNTIINSSYYMNINRTSTFNDDKFRKEMIKNKMNKDMIETIINIIINNDRSKYILYDDLMNLCLDGGCVADVGDDFNTILPSYTDDDDTNNKNATDKSPFIPNKCLSKTNGFLCNVRFANKNTDIHEFIKKNAIKEIQENLSSYTKISNKIQTSKELSQEESEYLSRYKSPVDLVVSIINNFIKKYYSNNLKDTNKDNINLNHYSKIYSEKIIKELAYLKKMNGIPEFVMSLYFLKEELLNDKIGYMPFKKVFPTYENVFNFGDTLNVDEILYSFDKKYGMKLNNNGFVPIFKTDTKQIIYFLNKEIINNPKEMTIQENGLLISFENNQGNIIKRNYLYKIPSLVDDCEFCKPPFSLIIKDDGYLCIYGNGYYDATSKKFKEFINEEINYINNYNNGNNINNRNGRTLYQANMNDISSIQKSLNEKSIKVEEQYLYCSPNSIGCKK